MAAFKRKNLDDFKTEIELLCLEVELLDKQTKQSHSTEVTSYILLFTEVTMPVSF